MQRIGDERALGIRTCVACNLLAGAQDHDLVDKALYHDLLEAIARRYRVIIAAIPDQRRRRHPAAALLARLQGHRRQRAERRRVRH